MKLVASLIVRNERARYLELVIDHLLEFCDEIAIVNDGSTDGTAGWLYNRAPKDKPRRIFSCNTVHRFWKHEGDSRQWLVDWTLLRKPTHILSIDADELVDDGATLRARLEESPEEPVWSLSIEEVWKADERALQVREDGGWRTHELAALWRAPPPGRQFRMLNRQIAVRRVPVEVWRARARRTHVSLLHLGWLDEETRAARYARYAEHDRGRFHVKTHLDSILWPDRRIRLRERPWPKGMAFDVLRGQLLARTI